MTTPGLGLIWAQSTTGVVGRDNTIPWRLPEDLARFKAVTMGHRVVMGRLTWESLPVSVRPLPGRRNIVVSRQAGYTAEGAEVVSALEDAPLADSWVIGGAQIYAQALPLAERCEVTEIDIDVDGDALAPVLDESWSGSAGQWQVSRSGLRYRFCSYTRRR